MGNSRQYKYKSWDDAFRHLVPPLRQHSARVAEYLQILFDRACISDCYTKGSIKRTELKPEYSEVAYKCGLYHQLGKSLLPAELQIWHEDFTEEDKRTYRRYPTEGRALIVNLQGESEEAETSTPNRMIREACEQHMERWNGSGYPSGRTGDDIGIMGQLTGLAKELDRLVCAVKSETPFEDAVDTLMEQKGTYYSADLISVLKAARGELRAVYKKYIQYTRTLPKTIPLVDKRPDRPFGLTYRLLPTKAEDGQPFVEAVPWFGAGAEVPEQNETAQDSAALLTRTGLLADVAFYFFYEIGDVLVRMGNCGLGTAGIIITMPGKFYVKDDYWERYEQLFTNQPIDRKKLILTVPAIVFRDMELSTKARLIEYIERGFSLLLDDYNPEQIDINLIQEIGFTLVRPALEIAHRKETREACAELLKHGITVVEHAAMDDSFSENQLIKELLKDEQ